MYITHILWLLFTSPYIADYKLFLIISAMRFLSFCEQGGIDRDNEHRKYYIFI